MFHCAIYNCACVDNLYYFSLFYFNAYHRQDNYNTAFTDALNQTYSIVTDPVGLKLFGTNNIAEGWPGRTLSFSITAFDELGTPTGSIVRISFEAELKVNQFIV